MLSRLNWILFPVLYPFAICCALVTMLLFRLSSGWSFPVRYYLKMGHNIAFDVLFGTKPAA